LASGVLLRALLPVSSPPKDGQPPQALRPGWWTCQRWNDQQRWRFSAAEGFRREARSWPADEWQRSSARGMPRLTHACTADYRLRHL